MGDDSKDPSRSASDFDSVQLRELLAPVCEDAGFELVEIECGPNGGETVLRVFIDYPPGTEKSISFDECTALSREVSAILDVEDPIASRYSLEVSSPGLDRPLRTPAHFRRYCGSDVKIQLRSGLDGRRNFKGVLVSVSEDDSSITVDVDETHFDLPFADLSSAKLIPDWSALMKGQGKRA
ncbi:MAG: ribosome maturation factor RimP [Myxococcales bacterium]|nr:ribosome maturation factor RimP [Myxococcales bacterium]